MKILKSLPLGKCEGIVGLRPNVALQRVDGHLEGDETVGGQGDVLGVLVFVPKGLSR